MFNLHDPWPQTLGLILDNNLIYIKRGGVFRGALHVAVWRKESVCYIFKKYNNFFLKLKNLNHHKQREPLPSYKIMLWEVCLSLSLSFAPWDQKGVGPLPWDPPPPNLIKNLHASSHATPPPPCAWRHHPPQHLAGVIVTAVQIYGVTHLNIV